jgi:hypothetical protein
MNNCVDNLLSYIPIYSIMHRDTYVSNKLNILKNKFNSIKDKNNYEMSWEVVEYYLILAYEYKF